MLLRYITAFLWLTVLLWLTRISWNSSPQNPVPDIAYYIVALFVIGVLAWPEWILTVLKIKNKDVKDWT